MQIRFSAAILFAVCLRAFAAVGAELSPTASPFKDGETVVFLGDSITQQAKWIRFLTDFYHTRYPERRMAFRNAGIAGNSFGGGRNQIPIDVVPWKPTTVVVMFGMNDSASCRPYHPGWPSTDKEREILDRRVNVGYANDAKGVLKDLRATCGGEVRVIMMTPSIYDSTARVPADKPVEYGWNVTLGESGKKLVEGHAQGLWELVDIWKPMTEFNAAQQKIDPKFSIVSDQERVHPDDRGGFFMAQRILVSQGADPVVSDLVFDAMKGRMETSVKAEVSGVKRLADGWEMKVLEKSLPFPIPKDSLEVARLTGFEGGLSRDDGLNREWFAAKALEKGVWELKIDEVSVWRGTGDELACGVNLAKNPNTPQMAQALKVTAANRARQDKESRLRALASLRWWLPMGNKVKDPDDIDEVRAWMEANPKNGGLFGGGKMMKEYLAEWPKRGETYREIESMDSEIAKLRRPVVRTWTLRRIEK